MNAGCTIEQIASWSNHKNLNALRALADADLELGPEIADQAGEKLNDRTKAKGFAI